METHIKMAAMDHIVNRVVCCVCRQRHCKTFILTAVACLALLGVSLLDKSSRYDILQSEFKDEHVPFQEGNIYPSLGDLDRVQDIHHVQQRITTSKATILNPHPFEYLHRPKSCDFSGDANSKAVLILVKSAARNQELRDAIRSTWGSVKQDNVRVMFMLGFNNSKMQVDIDREAYDYSDIVQENFKDAYLNNTLKTVMSFNFAADYCPNSRFILFVDDDFFVDIHKVLAYIEKKSSKTSVNVFEGFLLRSKVDRNRKSKWYISPKEYPYSRFPPYLAGGAYLSSFDVVKKFKLTFPLVHYIGIDDVWMGIVAKRSFVIPTDSVYFHNVGKYSHLSFIRRCKHDPKDIIQHWDSYLVNGTYHDDEIFSES